MKFDTLKFENISKGYECEKSSHDLSDERDVVNGFFIEFLCSGGFVLIKDIV